MATTNADDATTGTRFEMCLYLLYWKCTQKKSGPLEDEKINLQLEEWLDIALSYWALSMGVVTVEFLLTFVW